MSDSSSSNPPSEVPVVCSVCHSRLSAPASSIGKSIRCPDCHSMNSVKAPPPPKPRPKTQYTGDEYQLKDADPSDTEDATDRAEELVRLLCSQCSTMMYARVEHVGRKLRCPDCGTINVIPRPEVNTTPFVTPDISDITLDAEPPAEIDLKRKEVADRLMAQATEFVQKKESERPKRITKPFGTAIYRFAFYPRIIGVWSVLAVGLFIAAHLLQMILELTSTIGPSSLIAVFLIPILMVVTLGLLLMISPHFLTIIEHTAEGYDQIPYWPSQDMLGRGRALLLWINALAISTAPGMIAILILQRFGVPVPRWPGLITTVLLFPIVTLSMLANNSIFTGYSRLVGRSIARHTKSWRTFYLHVIGMASAIVAMASAGFWLTRSHPLGMQVVNGLLLISVSIYSVIYCRLLGHMGWIFSQDPELYDQDEIDEESEQDEVTSAVRSGGH